MQVVVTGFWEMALRAWTVGGTGSSARGGRGEPSGVLTRVGPWGPSSVGHPFPPAQTRATAHHGIRDGLGLAGTAIITRDAATNNSDRTAIDWGLRLSQELPPFYLIGSS